MITLHHFRYYLQHVLVFSLLMLGVSLAASATPTPVQAQSPQATPAYPLNQFTVEPAYQEIVLGDTQSVASASVTVRNTTGQATTFEVFALEFPKVDHFGSLQFVDFKEADSETKQVSYIAFDAQQFVLEPHHQRQIAVRITDRAELRPGGTYAAIIVRAQAQVRAGQQIVVPALASQLLIRKQHGEIRNLSLSDVQGDPRVLSLWLPKRLQLVFTNNGNVHLQPRGTAIITDLFNRVIAKGLVNDGSQYVLPGRDRTISTQLQQLQWMFPVSVLTLWIDGGAETTHYQYESTFIFISPWVAVVFITIVAARVYRIRQHKRRKKT